MPEAQRRGPMNAMDKASFPRITLGTVLPALALAGAAAIRAQDPAAGPATELPPLTVTAPIAPLDRSRQLLRLLVEKSAPCLGCDAVLRPAARPLTLQDYLLQPADRVDEATRVARDVKLQDSPDLQYLRR